MRNDRGTPVRSSPAHEPIRIEFYGSDGPGLRPVTAPPARAVVPGRGRAVATVLALALVTGIALVAVTAAIDRTGDTPDAGSAVDEPAAGAQGTTIGGPDLALLPSAAPAALPFPGGVVEPGRYRSDLLGLPIEFTVSAATALRTARAGTIVLSPVGTSPTDLRGAPHIQFVRVAGWNTSAEAADQSFRGVGSIAPDDIEGWIAGNDVIVDGRDSVLVDGRPAMAYDLRVDPASPLGDAICPAEARPCFWFANVAEELIPQAAIRLDDLLYGGTVIRMWLITIDGADPILVEAAAIAGDEAWLDDFEATTIATLTIGETAAELLAGTGSGVPAEG